MYDKTFFNRRLKVPRRPPWMLPFLPARSKLKSDRAARLSFRQCFATSAPVQHESIHQNCYWALIDATNRLNRPMQHILILFFVFSWLIVANRSSRETTSGIQKFPRRRKSGGGQYMINNGGSSSQPVKILLFSARSIGSTHIRRKSRVLVWKSGVNSGVTEYSVGKGQLTSFVQKKNIEVTD